MIIKSINQIVVNTNYSVSSDNNATWDYIEHFAVYAHNGLNIYSDKNNGSICITVKDNVNNSNTIYVSDLGYYEADDLRLKSIMITTPVKIDFTYTTVKEINKE